MNDTPTQTIADALLILSLGERNEIGKDAAERLMKLERENAALRDALEPFVKYGTEHGISDLIGRNGAVIRKSDWLSAIDAARKEKP